MAQTTNIGLYKLGAQSKLKDFPNLFNDDLDIIDSAIGGNFGQNLNPSIAQSISNLSTEIGKLNTASTISDLNTVTETCIGWASDSTSHRPADWCVVSTVIVGSNDMMQIAYCVSQDRIWYRRKLQGTWFDWAYISSLGTVGLSQSWFVGHFISAWGRLIVPVQNVYQANITAAKIYKPESGWIDSSLIGTALFDPMPRLELSTEGMGLTDGMSYLCSITGSLN